MSIISTYVRVLCVNRCIFSHKCIETASHVIAKEGLMKHIYKTPPRRRSSLLPVIQVSRRQFSFSTLFYEFIIIIPNLYNFLFYPGCGENMNAIQVISLTLLSVLAASAQVIMPGRCPQTGVQEDFDTTRVNINFIKLCWETRQHLIHISLSSRSQQMRPSGTCCNKQKLQMNASRLCSSSSTVNSCCVVVCFLCSILVSGLISRDCQTPSRRASAALPPTACRAPESLVSSTASCCEYSTWSYHLSKRGFHFTVKAKLSFVKPVTVKSL